LVSLLFSLLFFAPVFAFEPDSISTCEVFPLKEVRGEGPLPYNYRIIDGHIHAGGHPLNPNGFSNSDAQVQLILNTLRSKDVKVVVDLENTRRIQKRYAALLDKAGMERIHIPLSGVKPLTEEKWQQIKAALNGPVYDHCTWGADRTGLVIARYLMEEFGYTTEEAIEAVRTGGSHAGAWGGLKRVYYGLVTGKKK
jgi:hypothetical protein